MGSNHPGDEHGAKLDYDAHSGRHGRFAGYRSDWKKAYVKLKAGEKVPEYAEI